MTKKTIKFEKNSAKAIKNGINQNDVLILKIKTESLISSLVPLSLLTSRVPPLKDSEFNNLTIEFENDYEKEIYNDLLDDKNKNFSICFDEDKVQILNSIVNVNSDPNKPVVYIQPHTKEIDIDLKSKFSGIITIKKEEEEEEDRPIPSDTTEKEQLEQEIKELKAKINSLEEAQLAQKDAEIAKLKKQIENSNNKGLSGGVVALIVVGSTVVFGVIGYYIGNKNRK